MREILTILAIILIVILSAALAVPYFIDWNAERSLVEAQLSNLTGAEVKIRGGIDLKILPTPYLQLADVELAAPASGTDVKVSELHLEIALAALLRGEVDFVEAQFVAPKVKLRLVNGALPSWRPRHGFMGQMRFERVSVSDGSLVLDDQDTKRTYRFDNIALTAEADALTGPFFGDGHFNMNGVPSAFHLSTGARDGANLPLKLSVDESAQHPGMDFGGSLIFNSSAAEFALPAANGTLHLSGTGPFDLPWQANGTLDGTLRRVKLANLNIQFGGDLTAGLDGTADLDLGAAPRAHLKLKAQQINLDQLLAAKDAPAPIQRLAEAAENAASAPAVTLLGVPLSLDFNAQTLILGGDTLNDVAANIADAGSQKNAVRFSAAGPGSAHLALDGGLETGSAPVFKGHIAAGADDVARFREWLNTSLPQFALPDLPFQSADLGGAANISQVGAVGSDLMIHVNGSVLTGTLAYTKKIGTEPARLFADLSAQKLELPRLPDLSTVLRQSSDLDLALRFDARSVKLADSGAGTIQTGQIAFDFAKTGPLSQLNSLNVSGFDGANATAHGHWRAGTGGELALQLDTEHVGALATLAAHLAPSAEAEFIAGHSAEFSPMHLTLAIKGNTDASGSNLSSLKATGVAGATQFTATATPAQDKGLNVTLNAKAPEARALLRQMGFTTFPGKKLGVATLNGTAQGPLDHLGAHVTASLAGVAIDFNGLVERQAKADPHGAGTLKVGSADLATLLRAVGLADSSSQIKLPLNLSAAAQIGDDGLALRALSGTCGASKFTGDLAYSADKGVTGTLQTDTLSLGPLLQLSLGPARPAKRGAIWSDAPFAAPAAAPPLLVSLHARSFGLTPTIGAQAADFNLLLTGSQMSVQHFSAKLGAGRMFADLTLRRSGATAAVEGRVSLDHYTLDVPTGRGDVSGKFDVAGTGQSPATLIAGLAGSGTLTISDLLLMRSDPAAITQILSDVEEDRLSIDETEIDRALATAFDRHALSVASAAFDTGLAAGVLRLTGKNATPATGTSGVTQQTQASLDLQTFALDQSTVLTLTSLPRNWKDVAPQVGLEWTGPLESPVRNIDATGFVNALAARAISRETARIEAQEFDVHEHAVALARLEGARRQDADRLQAIEDVKRAVLRARARDATLDRLRLLLAAEKQKAAEKAAKTQPLAITPSPQTTTPATSSTPLAPAHSPSTVPADPSAAGRY